MYMGCLLYTSLFISIHRNASDYPGQYNGVQTLIYDDSGFKKEMLSLIHIWLIREAEDALTRYEPRIRHVNVTVDRRNLTGGTIYLNISYDVRATNNPNNLVFPYYLEEGIGEL